MKKTLSIIARSAKKIKYFFVLIVMLLTSINCSNMEPRFKVYGDKNILKDMKINVELINVNPDEKHEINSLLYNGNLYDINNNSTFAYDIYFAYKDSIVGHLKFDNIMQWADDYINHIYVFYEKDNDENKLFIKYVGSKSDIEKNYGDISAPALPLNQFFEKENIKDDKKKDEYRHLFFDYFPSKK